MKYCVEIENLKKEYEEFVLDSISLDIPRGYITGIIGPNGAGKTTTIKSIMNLIRIDGGRIRVLGWDHIENEIDIKNRTGYVGEEQHFYEHHSAAWTGKFVSHFYKEWDQPKFDRLLEEYEIPRRKWIRKYSKGMKVKLSLALALAHNPELIILDEPTAGLDPIIRREVLDSLRKSTLEENRSVVISSHITDDITRIADYIAYMVDGRIALFRSKDELLGEWKRIHFKKESLPPQISGSLEDVQTQMFGSTGITRHYSMIEDALAEGLARGDIKVENVGLDDILIAMVKGH